MATTTTKINRNSRQYQKPNGENKNLRAKKERKKEKIFVEPSTVPCKFCARSFFLSLSFFPEFFLDLEYLSRHFSRLYKVFFSIFFSTFFSTFFPDFFSDFFHSLSDTSKVHSWVEVLRDMPGLILGLVAILFIRSRLLHNQLLTINSNQ